MKYLPLSIVNPWNYFLKELSISEKQCNSLLSHGSHRLSAASERAFSTVSGTAIGWYWNVIQFSDQPHVSLRWCCNHLHQFPEMAKKSIQYIHYTVVKCIRRKFSQQY